jgi:signal transduction histidine kinase
VLDLSKIEAGKLELNFASVSLSEVVNQCVAIMQPQANRERIIIRTSLMPTLPPVVADERSMRQIVLNLLSNSIKFTGAGGQVIVSTALTEQGEAILRVRDTGIGMSEKEIATAMEPFRQVVSSGRSDIGTGLGLPLTKALAEANRATFAIKSAVDAGTLVEICFPATRVLAE